MTSQDPQTTKPPYGKLTGPVGSADGAGVVRPADGPLPRVRLSANAYTFGHWIVRDGERDHIDLCAPYQRASVWTDDQRQALIKSLYMGVPIGAIIVSKLPYDEATGYSYRVVDGKQRIEACRAWAADQVAVPTWWFDTDYVDSPADGGPPADGTCTYSQLSTYGQRFFKMTCQVPALEFDAQDAYVDRAGRGWEAQQRDAAAILVAEAGLYGLVNSGGTPHDEADLNRARRYTAGSS